MSGTRLRRTFQGCWTAAGAGLAPQNVRSRLIPVPFLKAEKVERGQFLRSWRLQLDLGSVFAEKKASGAPSRCCPLSAVSRIMTFLCMFLLVYYWTIRRGGGVGPGQLSRLVQCAGQLVPAPALTGNFHIAPERKVAGVPCKKDVAPFYRSGDRQGEIVPALLVARQLVPLECSSRMKPYSYKGRLEKLPNLWRNPLCMKCNLQFVNDT